MQQPINSALQTGIFVSISLQRIKKRAHFLLMRNKAGVVFMPCFVMQVAPVTLLTQHNIAENSCIIGFTVTKRVGNAVTRNRIRRRLKEAVRQIFPSNAQSGNAYVIIGTTQALTVPFPELLQQLCVALRKTPIPQEQLKARRTSKKKNKG